MHRYEHRLREPEGVEWRARRARLVALARSIIQPEVRAGRIAAADAALATEMLLALVRAAVLNHQDHDRPERAVELIVGLFLHGLRRARRRTTHRPVQTVRAAGARA
jgi:hypothetical protein